MGGDAELKRVHMIGNAHIDPVWLWQWPEGYQEVRATFQSAVERLDDYPEYVFTCDSSLFFAWVEESDPELFARIRAHVQSGRFQVIGGWWIEPDCNIPAGESFVRQALYGQRYLKEKFGITATTGANIDSFGHNATIPQILAKSGCDSYVFLRPGLKEKELPPLFWWESPDGSRVLAYRIPHEYCAPRDDIGEHVEKAVASLPDAGVYAVVVVWFSASVTDSTRPLEAQVTVRMAESGGRAVERKLTIPLAATCNMIGVKPLFSGRSLGEGETATFDVVLLTPDGKPLARKAMHYELLKVETRYQWYRQNNTWDYEPIKSTKRLAEGAFDVLADKPGRIAVPGRSCRGTGAAG